MKSYVPNTVKFQDTQRPLHRRIEELVRSEVARLYKRSTLKTLMKTGFKIRHVKLANKYLKKSSELVQHACDIFLARLIYKNQEQYKHLSRKELIKQGIKQFEKLDPEIMTYYISAAIIDDPRKSVPIASNAYHNFLVFHVESRTRKAGITDDKVLVDSMIKEGRKLWNKMKPFQKLPFFMLAYINTYYPRDIDGSIQTAIQNVPKVFLKGVEQNAEETIKQTDAENSTDRATFINMKHIRFDSMQG
ncbi:unnamed protein product [Hermetia illucens]|uniref:Uncharacterized protein n=1 Tax=Hermetia illucens TaxID=343691 RepID=A0A7R8URL7_HERIL|nr:unnamed protein product [Hermetia illucens]